MNGLPATNDALVLRTDFSDDDAWSVLCGAIRAPDPEHGFVAYVDCVSDPDYEGLGAATLVELAEGDPSRTYMFVVDSVATHHPEHPVLVLDLSSRLGRSFRVIPAEVGSVENNLSIANMDFEEFADGADSDGTFRGFPSD